jgi:ribosomal protein S18 acetylase RimI-like enzyme
MRTPSIATDHAPIHHVRWAVPQDGPRILAAEQASYDPPLGEEQLYELMRDRRTHISVLEERGEFAGYSMVSLPRDKTPCGLRVAILQRLAIRPDLRRRGLGSLLVQQAVRRLQAWRRAWMSVLVDETNIAAAKFLARNGGRSVLARNGGLDGADAYAFQFLRDQAPALPVVLIAD